MTGTTCQYSKVIETTKLYPLFCTVFATWKHVEACGSMWKHVEACGSSLFLLFCPVLTLKIQIKRTQ